jgi:hypothetical protein
MLFGVRERKERPATGATQGSRDGRRPLSDWAGRLT